MQQRQPSSSKSQEDLRLAAELKPHPRRGVVPAMSAEEYLCLRSDIELRGVLVPLEVTSQSVVLDGHHRLRAALELGIERLPVRLVAPADATEHMIAAALRRRQLSASQRAALALELDEYLAAKASARKRSRANLSRAPEVATLPPRGERTRELAARLAGVSPRTVQDVATVKAADPDLYAAIRQGTLPAHKAARRLRQAQRYAEIGQAPPLPAGSFQLIYADPPWQLGSPDSDYAPEQYYPTMSVEEIEALAPPAAENALLFLWAVNGLVPAAIEVIASWGFEYKTDIVWVKPGIGLGVWTRPQHELLLLARKGKFPPPEGPRRIASVVEAPRGRHSEKPAIFYELLERMYPQASKLELFARGQVRTGWSAWGNQVEAA